MSGLWSWNRSSEPGLGLVRRALVPFTVGWSLIVLGLFILPESVVGVFGRDLAKFSAVLFVPLAAWMWRVKPRHVDLAVGPLGLAVIDALMHVSGGRQVSPVFALVYMWVSVAHGLFSSAAALLTTSLAVFEVAAGVWMGRTSLEAALARVGFIAVFASLAWALVSLGLRGVRKDKEAEISKALRRVDEDARDFRLHGGPLVLKAEQTSGSGGGANTRQIGSVRIIRDMLADLMALGRSALSADAVFLFVLDEQHLVLKLKASAVRSGTRKVCPPRLSVFGGLGAVVRTGRAVHLTLRRGGSAFGYLAPSPQATFLGVPMRLGDEVIGVVSADRVGGQSFTEQDEQVLRSLAFQAERISESEQVIGQMDRMHYEQLRFYDAFSLLNESLTVEVFSERLLESLSRIKPFDFLALTLLDSATGTHRVVRVRAPTSSMVDALEGTEFGGADGGLVAMALKAAKPLPYQPLEKRRDRSAPKLFGLVAAPALASVKVFPMFDRGCALGSAVVGSTKPGLDLDDQEVRMIETIATHAGTTLANVQIYKRMEMMATTDGLTGLVNHRRFKELLEETVVRARRFKRSVSLMMVDADHFKAVNDNYGHPVGDLVLKRIGALLAGEARTTDVAARYGGEEFALILDETDSEGALLVAERTRVRVSKAEIRGAFGCLSVTVSIGLATWSEGDGDIVDLLVRADEALYQAKGNGRNRVEAWGPHCAQTPGPDIRLVGTG